METGDSEVDGTMGPRDSNSKRGASPPARRNVVDYAKHHEKKREDVTK
ncbi:MAG: hypothetical protein GY696_10815 [Gammaproteobacteria bacterium]|nr:hypothetical protein [Gammaproteobacteria bacterium]